MLKVYHRRVRRRSRRREGVPQGRPGREQPGLGQAHRTRRRRLSGAPEGRQAPPRQGWCLLVNKRQGNRSRAVWVCVCWGGYSRLFVLALFANTAIFTL